MSQIQSLERDSLWRETAWTCLEKTKKAPTKALNKGACQMQWWRALLELKFSSPDLIYIFYFWS
jgi:hypothetical protein